MKREIFEVRTFKLFLRIAIYEKNMKSERKKEENNVVALN